MLHDVWVYYRHGHFISQGFHITDQPNQKACENISKSLMRTGKVIKQSQSLWICGSELNLITPKYKKYILYKYDLFHKWQFSLKLLLCGILIEVTIYEKFFGRTKFIRSGYPYERHVCILYQICSVQNSL